MGRGFGSRGGGGGSGGGMGQMQNLMKQASQMQKKMEEAHTKAHQVVYNLEAAGGALKVQINGKLEIQNITLDESLMSDKETLQDALQVGFNEIIQKVNLESSKITESAGAGFKIPGMF